ncbi:hypothetical protein TNCV_4165761 [Trichonephila clavipes]|nr:hypothetical protein TNCV_4165761 [Trichonephila clavipes]
MADSLNINKEEIRINLHEDFGKTKVCAKFVPHTLSPEQKEMSRGIISATENDQNFLKSIVTGRCTLPSNANDVKCAALQHAENGLSTCRYICQENKRGDLRFFLLLEDTRYTEDASDPPAAGMAPSEGRVFQRMG